MQTESRFNVIDEAFDQKESIKQQVDVLIFDSGVGGLSIVSELSMLHSGLSICFYCDNRGFPYGLKKKSWLLNRVSLLFSKLLARVEPKAIVIACNTASTVVLDALRKQTDIPIIGVVPAIKPAAELTRTGNIGLIATPATVSRPYTESLIHMFAKQCNIIKIGSSRLVELCEEHLRGKHIDRNELAAICSDFGDTKRADVDVIVLGCTHFPLLKHELSLLLPNHVQWIDSGRAIARQIGRVIEQSSGHQKEKITQGANSSTYVYTKSENWSPLARYLTKLGFRSYVHFDI
jgi:glutamate racemase